MKQVDFAKGKPISNIRDAALPMLVAQMLSLLYSIVDRIYIGQIPGSGTLALGGIGLCFPVIIIVTAFTNLYGTGGAPLCSMARGQGDKRRAEIIMNLAFLLLVCTSLIILCVGELFAPQILRLFGASDQNMPYALTYLRIYLLGTTSTMVATGLNPYINAQGFAEAGMLTVIIGAVSNLILDPVLIFGCGMGTAGAALATIISQTLSALFVVRFLRSKKAELNLSWLGLSTVRRYADTVRNMISLGTAAFIMQVTNSLVSVSCNAMLSRYGGDTYVSVMTIISSVRQIFETIIFSITEGTSNILSFNYGARQYARVRAAFRIMVMITLAYAAMVWLAVQLIPGAFIRIFTSDDMLIRLAIPCLHLYFFAFVFQTFQNSGQTMFKALNKKKQAIFFSLLRKVVLVIPLTYLLPGVFGLGTKGVFVAEPISNVIGGLACFITMRCTVWRELEGS